MSRDYQLWLATDGEIRVDVEMPTPARRGRKGGTMWLPSAENFTHEEAEEVLTMIANRSRFNNRTMYLNGGDALGSGPLSSVREHELLTKFEADVRAVGERVKERTNKRE